MNSMQSKLVPARNNAGFSMIDVLIAIIVLATAMLALAALQGAVTRNSADARTRSQIAAFSEGMMEQMRQSGYDNIAAATINTANCATPTTTMQTLLCPNWTTANTTAGVSSLQTVTTVSTYYGGATGTFTTTAPSTITAATPQYKQLNVTTTWTDATGQSRTLKLDSIIDSLTTQATTVLPTTSNPATSVTQSPTVRIYNPAATAGVIPIAVGSSNTAATNPSPELLGKSGNLLVGTSFKVLTYQAPDTNNETVIQQLVDTRAIRCTCKFGAGNTTTTDVFAQPFRPTYWNGTKYISPNMTAAKYSSLGQDTTVTQDEFCDICCRDRNDPAATGDDQTLFDPFTTDHQKYNYNVSNVLGTVTTGDYLNACRLIRVTGQYRVATDIENYFTGLLATDTAANTGFPTGSSSTNPASSPVPDTHSTSCGGTNYVACYQKFVTDFLSANYASLTGSGTPSTVQTTLNAAAATLYTTDGLDSPTNINITYSAATPDYRYLHARGLYIDHLETAAITAINNAIANCPAASTTASCVLPLLPFTTINLTELANWTVTPVTSSARNDIQVSDTYIIGGDPTNPKRGVVNALSSALTGDVTTAVPTMGLSNSGLTGEDITDAAVDNDDKATLTDSQQFTIGTGASSGTGTVYVKAGFTGISAFNSVANISLDPSVSWSGTALQIGTAGTGSCTGTDTLQGSTWTPTYACTVGVTNTPPVALTVTIQNYNTQTTGSGGTGTSCAPIVATQCNVYVVSGATVNITALTTASLNPQWLDSANTKGLQAGTQITIPSAPGFSSTSSTTPDTLSIAFQLDSTNSYSVAGTCNAASCNGGGNHCNYIAGACSNIKP